MYFGRCVPWIIIDSMPYFRKWKLQPNKIPTGQEQWECTKQVLYSHFTIELPMVRTTRLLVYPTRSSGFPLDLVLPPNGRNVRHVDMAGSVSVMASYGPPDRAVLRLRGHLPLLRYVPSAVCSCDQYSRASEQLTRRCTGALSTNTSTKYTTSTLPRSVSLRSMPILLRS